MFSHPFYSHTWRYWDSAVSAFSVSMAICFLSVFFLGQIPRRMEHRAKEPIIGEEPRRAPQSNESEQLKAWTWIQITSIYSNQL